MTALYFNDKEFECPCCHKGANLMDATLLHILDTVREELGRPLRLTSAYRCPKHNEEVKGSPNSAHLDGKAVDISCSNSNLRMVLICLFVAHGIKRIGIAKTFIHIDVDDTLPQSVMWLY